MTRNYRGWVISFAYLCGILTQMGVEEGASKDKSQDLDNEGYII